MGIGRFSRVLPFAAGLGIMTAAITQVSPAQAQARGGIEWRGTVDGVARIVVQGQSVRASAISGRQPTNTGYRPSGTPLSRSLGSNISLQAVQGRGDVRIVQSPDRNNNYTAIVEVRDPQSGEAPYQFRLVWEENRFDNGSGGWNNGGGWGSDRSDNGGWRYGDRDNGPGRDSRPGWGNGPWNSRDRDRDRQNDRRSDDDRWGRSDRREDRDRDDRIVTPAERAAYQAGLELGRRDATQNQRRDASRHRVRYTGRAMDEFRRGYNNGFDAGVFSRRR